VLDAGFGLEQGFERYEAPARRFYGGRTQGYAERSAMETAALAATWLRERDAARPFFLWVHLWDAHFPYEPTPERLARAGGNPYLGEVAANDQAVGILVNALRGQQLDDSTLIIVVADHGEAFGEHGELSHGPFVWDTTLRVPLILRKPGGADGGRRVSGIASVADVFPTALEAMDLELDDGERDGLDGMSLFDDEPDDERGVYFESYYGALQFGWHPLSGWIDGAGKYVHGARERFFDPAADPGEEHELAAGRGSELARYRESIAALGRTRALDRDAEGVDPELRQALQAVGYAALASEGSSIAAPLAELDLPDPADRIDELGRFQRAGGLLDSGKLQEAETLLRSIVAENPAHSAGWDRLALCLIRQGRHAEAVAPLERVLAGSPGNADTWTYLGACSLVVGEEEKAVAAFTHALELDPNHVHALKGLVDLMDSAGLADRAAPLKERFVSVQSRP
jgi:tetratricopeptide (TPR) repeat protein